MPFENIGFIRDSNIDHLITNFHSSPYESFIKANNNVIYICSKSLDVTIVDIVNNIYYGDDGGIKRFGT